METLELDIPVSGEEQADILTAELSDLPFDSFEWVDGVLKAYAPGGFPDAFRKEADDLLARRGIAGARYSVIGDRNWNALWESGFTPVDVDGRIRIRAPYHDPAPEGVTEVIVTPRMAFGSGHHATTCLMAAALTGEEPFGRRVLDMGCGTGVLAILALKLGAVHADAVDIDEWSVRNCRENAEVNGVLERMTILSGDVRSIAGGSYDLVLANINRNVLTADMAAYATVLRPGGALWMSGFLERDIPVVGEAAHRCGLTPAVSRLRDGWAAIKAVK